MPRPSPRKSRSCAAPPDRTLGTGAGARRGFSLVELVVACLVFAVGVLAVQAAVLVALRQARDARLQHRATELAASAFERMVNASCTAPISETIALPAVTVESSAGANPGAGARTVTQTARFQRSDGEQLDEYTGAVRCR